MLLLVLALQLLGLRATAKLQQHVQDKLIQRVAVHTAMRRHLLRGQELLTPQMSGSEMCINSAVQLTTVCLAMPRPQLIDGWIDGHVTVYGEMARDQS